MPSAQLVVASAAYGDSFPGSDGNMIQEYVFELGEPIEDIKTAYAYGKGGASLVEKAQNGPVEVEYEVKENQYKGRYVKVREKREGGYGGGRGKSKEALAAELTGAYAWGTKDDLDPPQIVEAYRYFLAELKSDG